jgi:transposase
MSNPTNTRKNCELTDFERGEIIGAWKCGFSEKAIGDTLGRPKSTVHNVINKYKEFGQTTVAARSGRPQKLDDRAIRRLVNIVKENRQQAVNEITEKFNTAMSVSVSSRTVQRTLHESGFYGRAGLRKPFISEENRQKRVKWCLERKDWINEWELVIWSDESRYLIFRNDSRQWIWRRPHEKYDVDCLLPSMKSGNQGVMVWGCFTQNVLGPLIEVNGTINGTKYIEIMEQNLLPFLNDLPASSVHLFQDDNASVHRYKPASEWKEENLITSLPWPAQSPDLNPIEHLWDVLERRIRARPTHPRNLEELMDALTEEWETIEPDVLRNLVESMPRRVQAVIEANGYPTRY